MLNISRREISDDERQNLERFVPSFLFKKRKSVFLQELEEGIVEVLDFDVSRAWDLNGCHPPCCPHIYVFQACATKFIYGESWTAFNLWESHFPKRKMSIVRSPLTKRILGIRAEGEVLSADTGTFDSADDDFLLFNGAECEVFEDKDLPEEVRSRLTAPHNKLTEGDVSSEIVASRCG